MKQEQVTWYSNDGTLTLEMETPAFSPCFIFGDSFPTIHYRSINILKILKSKLNVLSECSNTQQLIFNSRNSIEIGKGYQVIEKWVFFKL